MPRVRLEDRPAARGALAEILLPCLLPPVLERAAPGARVTPLELVEDAFLSALEEGANPPHEFAITLPYEVWIELEDLTVRVGGFVLHLMPFESQEARESLGVLGWIH